jgi:hypothetical protein
MYKRIIQKDMIVEINGKEKNKPIDTYIDWFYPEIYDDTKSHLILGLVHIRAADSIRISYDSKRDGWAIEQASIFKWDGNDKICDPCWKEVAFIKAWGNEVTPQVL